MINKIKCCQGKYCEGFFSLSEYNKQSTITWTHPIFFNPSDLSFLLCITLRRFGLTVSNLIALYRLFFHFIIIFYSANFFGSGVNSSFILDHPQNLPLVWFYKLLNIKKAKMNVEKKILVYSKARVCVLSSVLWFTPCMK